MRLGVLDVGSNTVHLLVVDAHRGAHPNPMCSEKTQLRLAEHLQGGRLTEAGAGKLVRAVARAKAAATIAGCEELLTFAGWTASAFPRRRNDRGPSPTAAHDAFSTSHRPRDHARPTSPGARVTRR